MLHFVFFFFEKVDKESRFDQLIDTKRKIVVGEKDWRIKMTMMCCFVVSGEDEEWSDSEKTPSVSSGVEGGGSAVSSPIAPIVEEESSLPPPPRLNPPSSSVVIANSAAEDIRLRLSVLSEDARKRLASLTEDIEVKFNRLSRISNPTRVGRV